jgi:hypothetical protein
MELAVPGEVTMSKNDQRTGPSPKSAPASSRKALLELLGGVLKAQDTKPDELKAEQQRLLEALRHSMVLIQECSRSAVFLQHLCSRSTSVAAFVQQKCRRFAA